MVNFDINDYAPDVQEWIRNYEWPATNVEMKAKQKFVNSQDDVFLILEDSPAGHPLVKVGQILPFGRAIRYIHKSVVLA